MEIIQPFVCYGNSKYIKKLEKRKDPTNKFILWQNRQPSNIKVLCHVIISLTMESKLVSIQTKSVFNNGNNKPKGHNLRPDKY